MKVLVVDVGGTHVKILVSSQETPRDFESGPTLTPQQMVTEVHKLAADWKYEAVSIGYSVSETNNRLRKNHSVVASFHGRSSLVYQPGNLPRSSTPNRSTFQSVYEASMTWQRGEMLFLN